MDKINRTLKHHKHLSSDKYAPSIKSINYIWNKFKDTVMNAAYEHIPYSKVVNLRKNYMPDNLIIGAKFLRKLSFLLISLTDKKINFHNWQNQVKWAAFISQKTNLITDICKYVELYPKTFRLTQITNVSVFIVKEFLKELFKLLQVKYKSDHDSYSNDQMAMFIQRRCDDLTTNPKRFIDSTLNRRKQKIVLDRVLVKKDNDDLVFLTNKEDINSELINHFQTVAGYRNKEVHLPDR